jgi:ATP-dependent Clp protease, protease subunit
MSNIQEGILDLLETKGRFILKENIDLDQRTIQINTPISAKAADRFNRALTFLEGIHGDPINVVINSPGGSVYDAFAIIDRIQSSSCHITTIGTGFVASAAIPILASGNTRKVTRYTTLMYHEPSFNLPSERLSTAEVETKHVKQLSQRFNKFMAENSLKPYSFWVASGKHVDFYFDAEKALELGIIDEIVGGQDA